MDPFRTRAERREEPSRIEWPRHDRSQGDSAIEYLRLYQRKWLAHTLLAWLGMMALFGVVFLYWVFQAQGSFKGTVEWVDLLPVEILHPLIYVAPLIGWGAARDEVCAKTVEACADGWIVCARRPLWILWLLPVSVAASMAGFETLGALGFLYARVCYFCLWLALCWVASSKVGMLRWTRDGERALELRDLDGCHLVELESVDPDAEKVRFRVRGRRLSWRSVTPLYELARGVKPSPLART